MREKRIKWTAITNHITKATGYSLSRLSSCYSICFCEVYTRSKSQFGVSFISQAMSLQRRVT